jgi:hypothetical protein
MAYILMTAGAEWVKEIPFRAEAQAAEFRQHQRNLSVAKHTTGGGNLTD